MIDMVQVYNIWTQIQRKMHEKLKKNKQNSEDLKKYLNNDNKYMIKISGKMDKSNTYKGFGSNISFFIQVFPQTKDFLWVFQHLSNWAKIKKKMKV